MSNEYDRFTLRIPKELRHQLETYRKNSKVCGSLNSLVIRILWNWANETQKDEPQKSI